MGSGSGPQDVRGVCVGVCGVPCAESVFRWVSIWTWRACERRCIGVWQCKTSGRDEGRLVVPRGHGPQSPPVPQVPTLGEYPCPRGLHGGSCGLTAVSPRGYLYAGLEFGAECYCGHKIQAANVSEADCDMECKGERGSLCGGANRLSVYRLQLAQESARRCT